MYRSRSMEETDRRWRRFCRKGTRLAVLISILWIGGFSLLFRVAPAPEPDNRISSAPMSWWPAEHRQDVADIRTLWTPSIFALATPAGFSHALRDERSRLLPPVQSTRPAVAFLARPAFSGALDLAPMGNRFNTHSDPRIELLRASDSVFPPRTPEKEAPRMIFPEGWESRLFSGIELNFSDWTNRIWSARVEMQFDATGVPRSILLTQSSGLPEVDRRLTRSANGWRLLEPTAPRMGVVSWSSPSVPPPVTAAKGAS